MLLEVVSKRDLLPFESEIKDKTRENFYLSCFDSYLIDFTGLLPSAQIIKRGSNISSALVECIRYYISNEYSLIKLAAYGSVIFNVRI